MLEPPSSLTRIITHLCPHSPDSAALTRLFTTIKAYTKSFFSFSFDDPMRLPNQTKTTFKLLEKQMLFKPFL